MALAEVQERAGRRVGTVAELMDTVAEADAMGGGTARAVAATAVGQVVERLVRAEASMVVAVKVVGCSEDLAATAAGMAGEERAAG